MHKLFFIVCFIFTACLPMDRAWIIEYYNNSDQDMYFYLNYYEKRGKVYPYYGDLPMDGDPLTTLIYPPQKKYRVDYGENAFKLNETLLHVYAFSSDTLEKYSWSKVIETKNYWMGEIIYRKKPPIQFPEEFEYMGGTEHEYSFDRSNVVP